MMMNTRLAQLWWWKYEDKNDDEYDDEYEYKYEDKNDDEYEVGTTMMMKIRG